MKSILVVTGIIVCLAAFMQNEAQALSVGDEIMVGESHSAILFSRFQLGGIMEFVLDKELDPDTGTKLLSFEGDRYLFKSGISLFENVDIYAKIGLGKDKVENDNDNLKIESETGPAFGGGLRANLISLDDIGVYLGMDAQFLRFNTGIHNVNISSTNYDSVSGDFTVDQWQIALFLVKDFLQTTFYGGGHYADSTVKYDYDTSTGLNGNAKGKNDKTLGTLAGVNIHITDAVVFFAEGHLVDETSLTFGLNARF